MLFLISFDVLIKDFNVYDILCDLLSLCKLLLLFKNSYITINLGFLMFLCAIL